MTKGAVTCNLNRRVGSPCLNAKKLKPFVSGDEVEIEDVVIGDEYKGIHTWYKLPNDIYSWSECILIESTDKIYQRKIEMDATISNIVSPKHWWVRNFGIDRLWYRGLTGKNIKVAVLDTGISLTHDYLPKLDVSHQFDATNSQFGLDDIHGHGTHCSGVIVASNNDSVVKGIANRCDFYCAKITHDLNGDRNKNLWVAGIEWAISKKVDIISFSRGNQKGTDSLMEAIDNALKQNILVVAAAGNNGQTPLPHIHYPARYPGVLSVGAVDSLNQPLKSTIDRAFTHLFAPGENIKSTNKGAGYKLEKGSSQATPYVAGVAALLLEYMRKKNPKGKALDLYCRLLDHATTSADKSFKIIDPIQTLNNL